MIVKLRYVIKAISPAFYIAIVLVLVTCVERESEGSVKNPVVGVAKYYMQNGLLSERQDALVFGVCLLIFLGLVFLGFWDMIALYVSRLRYIPFEGELKKNKRRLL